LWTISLKYNTTVSRLCKLNGLTERDVLQIGQFIQVR
jgi:LysM repeat protein